ncbi:MAG: ExbD/TolR family protein [Bacillota bacterium]
MFKPTHKKKTSINIIPMIDVIFFLLVFFMLFTTFQSNPQGIDMQLPRAVTVNEQDQQNMIIDVDKNGNFYYDGERLPLGEIQEIARNRNQENENLAVIINADKEARYKFVVSLMDSLRQEGLYNLALAAEKEQE